jgi:hypothetical protein
MGLITVSNISEGINVKLDPSVIPDGAVADCVGFDVIAGGRLNTSGGIALNDISDLLPSKDIDWMEIRYIGSVKYVLVSTSEGLYSNGVLISAAITGRFRSESFLNNIYIVNSTAAIRYDGTTCYQWGIDPPTGIPTIAPGTHLSTTIHTFETMATWIANASTLTVAAEGTIKKQGSYSMKATAAISTSGYSYVTASLDLTKFSNGTTSNENDYISCQIYIDDLTHLEGVSFVFDTGDVTFKTDTFTYDLLSPTVLGTPQAIGSGQTANIYGEDTLSDMSGFTSWNDFVNQTSSKTSSLVLTSGGFSTIDSEVGDQTLTVWKTNPLFQLKSATWQELRIPKSMFTWAGAADWATVKGLKIKVTANDAGAVNVYFDDWKMIGGSELSGTYWFMYTFFRGDSNNTVIHESPPAIANRLYVISEPVVFDRHPLVYSARPLSTDPQVTGGNIYATGEDLGDFWLIASVLDNTTVTDTVYGCEGVRILNSKHNFPAPPGTDLILFKNKFWMIGDPSYPMVMRTSDILEDGTLAPEGWPPRNGYELSGNQGELLNVDILNETISVKGKFGEWKVDTTDPTDFLQVTAKKVSDYGLLSQDAIVRLPAEHIYPSKRGFIRTTGSTASFIFPELEPLIDSNIDLAMGVNAGLVSYFTYRTNLLGDRTAKIDLYNGKPRFTNINNVLFNQLSFDPLTDNVYCLYGKEIGILDSGTKNEFIPGGLLYAYLKSRTYQPGNVVGWTCVAFRHNTGGVWYRLNLWVEGTLAAMFPFKSNAVTEQYFRFGPYSGYDFYFEIVGDYDVPGQIIFPIRIYHSGK